MQIHLCATRDMRLPSNKGGILRTSPPPSTPNTHYGTHPRRKIHHPPGRRLRRRRPSPSWPQSGLQLRQRHRREVHLREPDSSRPCTERSERNVNWLPSTQKAGSLEVQTTCTTGPGTPATKTGRGPPIHEAECPVR